MTLAPARLLLPMRGVEPAHPSTLSSASICSVSGAYPHFSLFFFPPLVQRSCFSVSASVVESYGKSTYKPSRPLRRHSDDTVLVEELHSHASERRLGPHSPYFDGRARPARRYSKTDDGNGSRRTWESGKHPPWKNRGITTNEVKVRQNKPPDSYSRWNSTSSTSYAEDDTFKVSRSPKVDDRKNKRFGWESRDGYIRPNNAYFDSRNASQERQRQHSQWDAPLVRNSMQANTPNSFSLRKEHGYEEQRMSPHDTWRSGVGSRQKFEQQAERRGRYMSSYTPNTAMSLQSPAQSSFSTQSIIQDRRWEAREVKTVEVEERPLSDNKWDVRNEREKDNTQLSGSSSISKIIEKLRSIEDRIPPLYAKEELQPSRELADVLGLPSARDYLSDRTSRTLSAEQPEKGAPVDTRFPWERNDTGDKSDSTASRERKSRPLSQAEETILGPELRRLRILAVHLKQRVKIGKHGVTKDAVDGIRRRFVTCEVVKVKCEGPSSGNMKKTIETLEEKTGGSVIWRAGSIVVLYRGQNYGQPVSEVVDDLLAKKYESLVSNSQPRATEKHAVREIDYLNEAELDAVDAAEDATGQLNPGASLNTSSEQLDSDSTLNNASEQFAKRSKTSGSEFESLEAYVLEVDDILQDLGPRYDDWTGPNPVPIDADLLPKSIPIYSPPYRLLPFGVRPNISNTYATHLRRLSRPLAPHFIIGRDRDLQGLAFAMTKLWEKSEIAKIGVKRGVLNTNHERISEELKRLTGGLFLCRDKYSMTFYRGKDFLPPTISGILANRQTRAEDLQIEEERGRGDGSLNMTKVLESLGSTPSWVHTVDVEEQIRLKREATKTRRIQVIAYLERKMKVALKKKEKAGIQLEKVEKLVKPVAATDDKEILTDEERFMLKKLGLKMRAFLLLGRRGVFSGVVQNMHLHWKHRELVKIVIKERDPVRLNETARMLEAESGGILISVDPTSKGFAIVVYRGKNYARPPELRPTNLLTKRLALQRSLEIQRRQSLTRHMQGLEEEITHLRAGLSKMKMVDDTDESNLGKQSDGLDVTLMNDVTPGEPDQERSAVNGPPKLSRRKLRSLCEIGPIYKAVRFSKLGRHQVRCEVLKLSKAPHFLVGRSNPMSTIAKQIRVYFLDHAFVKIGVNYRPRGTSVQDVVEELEDLTGGAAYAQDDFRVILYRGWPSGEDMPLNNIYDVLSPTQLDILEEDEDENDDHDEEALMQDTEDTKAAAVEEVWEVEKSKEGEEDIDEKMSRWDILEDDEDIPHEGANTRLRSDSFLVSSAKFGKEQARNEGQKYVDEEISFWSMSGEDEDGSDDKEGDIDNEEALMQDTKAAAVEEVWEVKKSKEVKEDIEEEMSRWDISEEDEDIPHEGANTRLRSDSFLVSSAKFGEEQTRNEGKKYVDEEISFWSMSGEDEDGGDDKEGDMDSEVRSKSFLIGSLENENQGEGAQSSMMSTFVTGSAHDKHDVLHDDALHDTDYEYQGNDNTCVLVKNDNESKYSLNNSSIDADTRKSSAGLRNSFVGGTSAWDVNGDQLLSRECQMDHGNLLTGIRDFDADDMFLDIDLDEDV